MAVVSYKGIDVVAYTEDGVVQLVKSRKIVFEQDLAAHIKGMSTDDAENCLIRAGVVLADEYLDGSLSDMQELEPWE